MGIAGAAQRLENIDARVLPFEVRPVPIIVAPPMFGGLERLPRLAGPPRGEQAARDLGSDFRDFPGLFVELLDESVDVTHCVSDVLQRMANPADAGALDHLVGIDWSRGGPADFHAILVRFVGS